MTMRDLITRALLPMLEKISPRRADDLADWAGWVWLDSEGREVPDYERPGADHPAGVEYDVPAHSRGPRPWGTYRVTFLGVQGAGRGGEYTYVAQGMDPGDGVWCAYLASQRPSARFNRRGTVLSAVPRHISGAGVDVDFTQPCPVCARGIANGDPCAWCLGTGRGSIICPNPDCDACEGYGTVTDRDAGGLVPCGDCLMEAVDGVLTRPAGTGEVDPAA